MTEKKKLTTLSQELQGKLVKNIITDSIIFERTFFGVNEIIKAFNPKEENWEADSNYNGIGSCFPIMGYTGTFEDEKITDKLYSLFVEKTKKDFNKPVDQRYSADDLAEHIYIDWLSNIKAFNNISKT